MKTYKQTNKGVFSKVRRVFKFYRDFDSCPAPPPAHMRTHTHGFYGIIYLY